MSANAGTAGRRMTLEESHVGRGHQPVAATLAAADAARLHQLAQPLFGYVGGGRGGDKARPGCFNVVRLAGHVDNAGDRFPHNVVGIA